MVSLKTSTSFCGDASQMRRAAPGTQTSAVSKKPGRAIQVGDVVPKMRERFNLT